MPFLGFPTLRRTPSERQGHAQRPSNGPLQSVPARNTHTVNQSVQRAQSTTSPIGWSSYPSGAPQSPGPMQGGRSQTGNPPPLGGYSRNGGAYSGGSGFPPQAPQVAPPNVAQDEWRTWFTAIDGDGDGVLSSDELHSALFTGRVPFSANTVRYLVSIFDRDGDGMIGPGEFEHLWNYMNEFRQMFDSFDTDRNGKIDAGELGRALAYYQLDVPSHILGMVIEKYGIAPPRRQQHGYGGVPARPQLDLDHFVCACVVVRQMCGLYNKCCVGGRAPISRDEFLQTVIFLP